MPAFAASLVLGVGSVMDGLLTATNVAIAVVVAAAAGGWVGWTLRSWRARARREAENAYESEVVRASHCARDRAIEEREHAEQLFARLQEEHSVCETRTEGLAKKLGDRDATIDALKGDLAGALEGADLGAHRTRELERRIAELETALSERDRRDGAPGWLLAEPDGPSDDLTHIKGLGPVLEQRLNEIGIYHFKQLAQMTDAHAHWVAGKIHVVAGRILRDQWARQARENHVRKHGHSA